MGGLAAGKLFPSLLVSKEFYSPSIQAAESLYLASQASRFSSLALSKGLFLRGSQSTRLHQVSSASGFYGPSQFSPACGSTRGESSPWKEPPGFRVYRTGCNSRVGMAVCQASKGANNDAEYDDDGWGRPLDEDVEDVLYQKFGGAQSDWRTNGTETRKSSSSRGRGGTSSGAGTPGKEVGEARRGSFDRFDSQGRGNSRAQRENLGRSSMSPRGSDYGRGAPSDRGSDGRATSLSASGRGVQSRQRSSSESSRFSANGRAVLSKKGSRPLREGERGSVQRVDPSDNASAARFRMEKAKTTKAPKRENGDDVEENEGGEGEPDEERQGAGEERRDFRKERRKDKHPSVRPQVSFEEPMRSDPNVAIIGGGISGIVCALTLAERGIMSTVFDTGKHGLGGRMATRHIDWQGNQPLVFDHAAQFFTVSDPRFQSLVDRWLDMGLVKEWEGLVGTLRPGGEFAEAAQTSNQKRYIGAGGMKALCDRLVETSPLITVRRPVWISHLDPRGSRWALRENTRLEGVYDAVVVAHNGKCANRLLAPAGVPLVAGQMKRLQLSAVWALMAAFDQPLPLPRSRGRAPGGPPSAVLGGAFVEGVPAVAWMGNNSAKLALAGGSPECWTFFSSGAYGKRNKVPQEAIPRARAARVQADMLAGVELALGVAPGELPAPVFARVQLWGAALPLNAPGVECIFDATGRVGICGDWLLSPCVEGAALSGMALANHLANFRDNGGEGEEFSVGLETRFNPVESHDIGAFPDPSVTSNPIAIGHVEETKVPELTPV